MQSQQHIDDIISSLQNIRNNAGRLSKQERTMQALKTIEELGTMKAKDTYMT